MSRIVAIDYGEKRTGLATTDPLQLIASPLTTVNTNELFDFLEQYLKIEKVETIVIGVPNTLNNQTNPILKKIETFTQKLQQKFPNIALKHVDERFTSKMASQAILKSGAKKIKRQDKSLIDKVSAAIILQSYLDSISFFK